jgi:hypothetical protein
MKKRDNYLIFFAIISGLLMIYCLQEYTVPTEYKNFKNISLIERLNIVYKNNHPKFNYFNGLWLMFAGIFFFCIIVILEIPQEHQLLKEKIIQKFKRYKS